MNNVALPIFEHALHDSSYVLQLQFTARVRRRDTGRLEALEFSLIEAGHGKGPGASKKGIVSAAASDVDNLAPASPADFCRPTHKQHDGTTTIALRQRCRK